MLHFKPKIECIKRKYKNSDVIDERGLICLALVHAQ